MKLNKVYPMHYGASTSTMKKAHQLRKEMTDAEMILWQRLRGNAMGSRFRRQHAIRNYIVDFYCHTHKLIVEVDGGIHLEKENIEYDNARTELMEEYGLKVIRFSNEEVLDNIELVLSKIRSTMTKLKME